MPLLKCKEPGCPCQVDTALACSEVQSLFGMRVILEQHRQENNLILQILEASIKELLPPAFLSNILKPIRIKDQSLERGWH